MKIKNKFLLKKLLSVIISLFLFNSFVVNNFAYAAPIQLQSIPIHQNNNILKTTINPSVAYVTEQFTSPNDKKSTIFFIQDLHTNPSVQKNISKILEQLDNKYGIDYIYMEGLPAGKANTAMLNSLKEYNVSDKLIDKNIITGTEYYFLNNNTKAQIYGLEDWNKYLSNIKRAAEIIEDQEYITQTYNDFKKDLYANIKDIKKVEKYIHFNLADDKILKITNQPILKYGELHKYISLSDDINNLNIKRVTEEHKSFINDLKSDLPISVYKDIISLSKKENLKEYYTTLHNLLISNNNYKEKYQNLNKLLEYTLQKEQLNIVNLISQQNKYFNDYLSSISNDKFQQDMFVVKMTQIFQNFLTLSISDEDYNFFTENYQRYINLLPKYLAQNYDKYTDLLFYDIIFDYHKINKDRNIDFIKNISANLKNKQDNNKVTVVIAGGFHSSILEKLKKEKYSYFLITPNIDQSYDTDYYDEMILSSISDNVETNALAPIRVLLTAPNIIPRETVALFIDSLINALVDKSEISPKELKDIITSIAREKIVINNPITIEIKDSKFIVNIYGNQVIYRIENNKVVWQSVSTKYAKKRTRDLSAKVVAKAKRKFNILEATSLQLNPNSRYASKFISRREGTKRNFMFTLSMFFSSLKMNDFAYDLMMGFASLNKNKTTKITIDFDADFGEDVKKLKEFSSFKGKKFDITIENGLNKYLSKEDILNIVAASISRLDTRPMSFKDGIFIGYLDKSTNLFEDHLNNGFIGVNAGIFQMKDEDVKKAIIHAGIIHELTHEFKGSLNSLEYDIFEERMMFCDMKFLIEYMAKIEYGKDIDFGSLLYSYEDSSRFDHIVQRIIAALTAEIQEPGTGKNVPLFTENVRFIRKFQNYKYNIDDISGFIKRKNFSIRERRGQLKHIENEYLSDNDEAQEKLFSSLAVSEEKTDSMEEFLKKHIPEERLEEVTESIEKLIANFKKALYSSDLDPKIIDKKVKEFEQYIYECLHLMYKKMPDYLFGIFYNEQGVIADHALNHSIELLNNAIPILKNNIDKIETLDLKSLIYSAFLHDVSCTLIRLNHEKNSATFARAILQGEMTEEEINKIYDICIGHKKIKNGILRDEHKKYLEARIIHDADGLSAALALDRILGVWLTNKEIFLNRNLTIEERIRLINENKYLMVDGGDAINDLLRQFLRRDRKFYITEEAGDLIESQRQPRELYRFFTSKETKERIKNAGMNVSDKDLEDSFTIMEQVLNIMLTQKNDTEEALTIQEDIQSFGFREKINLFKQQIHQLFNKARTFTKTMVVSDIHGGYARFAELIITLLDPKIDLSEKTDREIDDIIIDRLQNMGNNIYFYLLGDLLDRGSRQVETFELVKRISETGRMKYVVGNHDLYAFMNILGLHLPSYKNYKGIPDNYIDFQGRNIKALLEKLQSEDRRFLASFNINKEEPLTKAFWAAKLDYYMKYAEEEQKKWGTKEKELQEQFEKAFGFKLDSKGKDVLNNPTGIFAQDKDLLNFNKKFFGRNVGIVVYTGIRAVNKMSINWWLDRETELEKLKDKYSQPQYKEQYGEENIKKMLDYFEYMSNVVKDIIDQQQRKYNDELNKGNIAWSVIDAIMYRNYESTEWNALDWVYHKNWGGGDKGFIAQRNAQLEERGKHKINRISYFDDSIIQEMLNFYQQNFYLYRFDNYGICYMHSMLPVDDDGDVSIGYVDENGIFHERDSNGKRIKGFIYKGVQYKGKKIFKGLSKIAEDIRTYDTASNNLSEIMEALTLLTAIYADNTTRIKPANLKQMRANFGFNKILKQKGITTIVVGHNPVTKLDNQFEYATLRFFNKELKIINVVQIDGNMSPEYAPPKGAGLVRFIGGGITTRGFISGESTEITSSATPDVSREIFINSIILNIFPWLKDVLLFTEKVYNGFSYLKQRLSFGNIKINKRNTTIVDILQTKEELQNVAEAEHVKGIKNIVIAPSKILEGTTFIEEDKQLVLKDKIDIEGTLVNVEIKTHKIKVAKGFIPVVSYSYTYDKENATIEEQTIQDKIKEYIIDQINRKTFDIKTTKNMFVNNSVNDMFETVPMSKSVKKIFGPILYDTRAKKATSILENMTDNINIDKIKDILSAA